MQPPQAVKWWPGNGDRLSTSITDESFIAWHAPVSTYSWSVRHVTALILFHYFTSIVTTVFKQQRCWKLKTINMPSFNTYTFCTHCLCCHIYFSCSHHKQLNDDLKDIIHCGACSSWANVDDKIFLERVVSATIQSNLSLADMLHNGDLVIEDTFLSNRLNHGQTLIENPLYSGHIC